MSDIDALRAITATTQEVMAACTADITHEESLRAGAGDGNGMNWILGHVTHVNDAILRLLGADGVLPVNALARYAPDAPPITDPAEARPFDELRTAFLAQTQRLDATWAAVDPERLQGPPPPGFDGVLGDFLRFIVFHQAYHTGQCGILRRQLGRGQAFG